MARDLTDGLSAVDRPIGTARGLSDAHYVDTGVWTAERHSGDATRRISTASGSAP